MLAGRHRIHELQARGQLSSGLHRILLAEAVAKHQKQVRFAPLDWPAMERMAEKANSTWPSSDRVKDLYVSGELSMEDFEDMLDQSLRLEDPDWDDDDG